MASNEREEKKKKKKKKKRLANDNGSCSPVLTPSETEYWEAFYDEDGEGRTTYEWYASYPSIRQLLLPFLFPNSRILHIGCGNSLLAEQLVEDPSCPEAVSIMSIDINETAIHSMKEREEARLLSSSSQASKNTKSSSSKNKMGGRTKGRKQQQQQQQQQQLGGEEGGEVETEATKQQQQQLEYEVRDVCATGFEEGEFDLVIDKGMLDAFLSTGEVETGENDLIRSLIAEVFRVLSPGKGEGGGGGRRRRGGVYLVVSRNASFLLFPYFYELGCVCEETHFQHSTSSSLFFYIITPPSEQEEEEEEEKEMKEVR